MDLEGLRCLGVDYTILDKDSSQTYDFYENICLDENNQKGNIALEVQDPEEKRLLKLEVNRIRMAERRAKETDQERALRLYKNRMRNKVRRATETVQQRADRNRRNMERNRERRIKRRLVSNGAPTIPDGHSENPRKIRYYINDLLKVELTSSPPRDLPNFSHTTQYANNRF
ncbi:uncharacterized protein LOC143910454 isoform X1 [Arctopsyche grandis]|uniref:uncharacterized protein LOC143910454 isoform X1 n=1 Tax=Arctopsyche grandis TaxID=121162 RepID=UPI00406D815D